MTTMMKLGNGEPLFSPPFDANSFIYTGTMERLSFLIINIFDLELDIRVFKTFSVAILIVSSFFLGISMAIILDELGPGSQRTTKLEYFFFALANLFLISRSFTSDIPHPDNLQIMHFSILLFLTFKSVQKRSLILGGLATLFGGLGFLAKQTAVLACGTPIVSLAWIWRKRPLLVLGFLVIGATATALLLSNFISDQNAWIWAFDVPGNHPLKVQKLAIAFRHFFDWPDAGVVLISAIALLLLYFRMGGHRQRPLPFPILLVWMMGGLFAAWPNLAGFIKSSG
jgi:hypothetical protein